MRKIIPLASGLALLACAAAGPAALAQTARGGPSPGTGVTTGDLARLCAAGGGGDVISGAAVGYCRGFMIATGQYHAEVGARRTPVFCLPEPAPSIEGAQESFVAWVQANPQFAGDKAVEGLLRWASATFPCPAAPARAATTRR